MTTINDILNNVNYYQSIFEKYPNIENPIAVLDSEEYLTFIPEEKNKDNRPAVDQLKNVTDLITTISEILSDKSGNNDIVTKLSQNEYDTLVRKLHYIEEKSLEIARRKVTKSKPGVPIARAESRIARAFSKIEKTYPSFSSIDTPAVLKNIEQRLQQNSSNTSQEIEDLYKKYVSGKHTLNEVVNTVDHLSKLFTSLQTGLREANRQMNNVAQNVENKDPDTKWHIFDNLRSFDKTVKEIFKSLETNRNSLENEIKNILIVPEIETALQVPIDPDRLGSLINEKLLKLTTVYSKLAPALSESNHMEPNYFLVNLSQMQLIMANLKLLKEQIVTLTNPNEATGARERFARSDTLNQAEWMISEIRKNPLWAKALDEKQSVVNFTFKTNFWLLKDIKLRSMSDVQKITEILGIYRDNLKGVYLEAKKLSTKLKQPKALTEVPQAVAMDESTMRKSERYVKKPMF